ncbi:acid phosphatase type 7-like [Babylonia areolata]|uniref:acid phosphatase type 7-like n=1 Tax=Babylonia areolata TaxID=304850 RepID=UPI003FD2A68D
MRKCKKPIGVPVKRVMFSTAAALVILIASFVDGNIEEDEASCKPQHVHIAYGDALDEVVVMWATDGICTTELEFTTGPWEWSWKVVGSSTEFWEQNAYGLHNLHRAKLTNLHKDTTYYYRPLSNNIGSGPFYFKTPFTDVNWSPRFLVYGDLGVHTHTIPNLVDEALTGEYTAVIHAGDFAYNLKDSGGVVGDQFMELIEPIAAFLPYMTCPGNHEIDSDSFTHYNHRFSMPGSPWPMTDEKMWYSFNVGPAHFISYSSEVFFTRGGKFVQEQYDWLVNDLREANKYRSQRPWIIAFGHRPMYCSSNTWDDCSQNNSFVRQGLEDLFYGFGVDIVFQAHEHNYERLYPMYKGVTLNTSYVDPPGPVHIISGAAGSKHGVDPFKLPPKPEWSAVRVEGPALNSYGHLQVVNGSHVYWEQRSIHNHTVLDSLWIVQHHHRKFWHDTRPTDVTTGDQGGDDDNHGDGGETLSDLFADEDARQKEEELKRSDRTQRIAIGASFGVLIAIVAAVAIVSRACRRHQYSVVRRWDAMDLDYGRKLFSAAREEEHDLEQHDFEVDMGDVNGQSKKLLNNS